MTRPALGVIVPLANEAGALDAWLRRLTAQLEDRDRVFCVVDRVSVDDTRAKVEAWQQRDGRVSLEWAPDCRDVADAYRHGLRQALSVGYPWLLEMDVGHFPEQIPRFLEAMADGIDFAAGSRFVPGAAYEGRGFRYWLSRGGSAAANLALGTGMRDMTSGFECYNRRAAEHVLANVRDGGGRFFQTEVRFLLRDWRWREIPITYVNPSPRVTWRAVRGALADLWTLRRSAR